MTKLTNKIIDVLAKASRITERIAYTGKIVSGNVEPSLDTLSDGGANKVWVRFTESGGAVEAYNLFRVNKYATNVRVVVDVDESDELYIKRVVNNSNVDTLGANATPVTSPNIAVTDTDSISPSAINKLRPTKSDSGGLNVAVSSYLSQYGFFAGDTFDFAGDTPPTSGKYRWAVCYLDTDTLTLQSATYIEQDIGDFSLSDIGKVIVPANAIRICAIFLLSGQTTYQSNELRDIREVFSADNFTPTVYTDVVSDPPTDAELDALYGTPASVGLAEFFIDNNGADTNVYKVLSNGISWWVSTLTKAT